MEPYETPNLDEAGFIFLHRREALELPLKKKLNPTKGRMENSFVFMGNVDDLREAFRDMATTVPLQPYLNARKELKSLLGPREW